MSTEIERLVEKLQSLSPEQQREVIELVERLAPGDATRPKTIGEKIREHAKEVPDEVWERMPRDGAEQHDHYLYGTPKK